jgi:hypothetical protein
MKNAAFAGALAAALLLAYASPAPCAGARHHAIRHAAPVDPHPCRTAAAQSEADYDLPPKLLGAIAMVESGRIDPRTGEAEPWPWTANVEGTGYFFPSKQEAITFVTVARSLGVQSIDVGCLQVNLMYHPDAFADLDQAFTPAANAHFAARFLIQLHAKTGSWASAAAAYHSQTPSIGAPYEARVAAFLNGTLPDAASITSAQRAALAHKLDPYGVLTPQFRDYLVGIELDRLARRAGASKQVATGKEAVLF